MCKLTTILGLTAFSSDEDSECVPIDQCKNITAGCDPSTSVFSECLDEQCFLSCDAFVNKLPETCEPVSNCDNFGCVCKPGFVKLNATWDSPCVENSTCPFPECPENQEFSMCGKI